MVACMSMSMRQAPTLTTTLGPNPPAFHAAHLHGGLDGGHHAHLLLLAVQLGVVVLAPELSGAAACNERARV